jgi:hypothetical protein
MFQKIALDASAWMIGTLFGLTGFLNKGRATHRYGVGAAGTARIVDDPKFPAHPFFKPGREFPVQIRHATVTFEDDATLDIRSGSLKFSDQPSDSPLDLIMNTGERVAFWNVPSFVTATLAVRDGEAGGKKFIETSPDGAAGTLDSVRRAPASFTQLYFFSKVVLGFTAADGTKMLVKFRLAPEDKGAETGMPTEQDLKTPWKQARVEGDDRPQDYLRTEFLSRFKGGGRVVYHLQMQLHSPVPPDGSDVIYHASRAWDPETHPWLDVATVTLTRALSLEEVEGMKLQFSRLPEGMHVPPARSMDDFTSLGYVRSRVYPRAGWLRLFGYRLRGQVGPRDYPHQIATTRTEQVVTGTLVHADAQGAPLHHASVELIDRDLVGDDALAEGVTDADGKFRLVFNPTAAGCGDKPDLALRVVELDPYVAPDGSDKVNRRVIHTADGPDDFTGAVYDFGKVSVPWWEYDADARFARAGLVDGNPPQDFAPGEKTKFAADVALITITRTAHAAISTVDPEEPSLATIQAAYPVNLTQKLGAESRTDAFFGERLLNGFSPVLFDRDEEHEGGFRYRIRFDQCETNGRYDLANVDVRFALEGAAFLPQSITISFREAGHNEAGAPMTEPFTLTPKDGERWLQAKRVARCAWLVDGEVGDHLGGSHLNVEQYAVAAWRNLRRNPVRRVLFPHLRSVVSINRLGDSIIFGPSGIITANSPLTADAVAKRIIDHLATQDWRTFEPRKPVSSQHRYAKAARLYWEVLTEHVDAFFAAHQPTIEKEWLEVRRFSDDLVHHSVAYQPPPQRATAYCQNELDDPEAAPARVRVGERLSAVRPITQTDTPQAGEIELLKQVCRYAIFKATFFHTWTNNHQVEDAGELLYCSHSLRNGSMAPESDLRIALAPREATEQLFFANSLSVDTKGHVVLNEEGDIPATLPALLVARREAFSEVGVDVSAIRSRVNI